MLSFSLESNQFDKSFFKNDSKRIFYILQLKHMAPMVKSANAVSSKLLSIHSCCFVDMY